MSYLSPQTVLLWAILSILLQGFLVTHLYRFDRFKCLRWNAGQQPGAFQRVMTYTYLATMPLLVVFSTAMTVLKYREGYVAFPVGQGSDSIVAQKAMPLPDDSIILETGPIVPKPFSMWHKSSFELLRPLYILFSVAWSFELVTHLEELNFWLFVINQGPRQKPWFKSYEFQTWVFGSIVALTLMPVVAIFAMRSSVALGEAWIFFIGSLCSMAITIMFLYVLWKFPKFLARIRSEGAPPAVVIRLTGFHEINVARVGFRFLFTIPLFVLAVDGIRSSDHHPILASRVSVDILGALGGIGCMISSILTLLVFFPRSRSQEAGYNPRDASTTMHHPSQSQFSISKPPSRRSSFRSLYSKADAADNLSLRAPFTDPQSPVIGGGDAAPREQFVARPPPPAHRLQFRTEPPTPATVEDDSGAGPPRFEDIQMQDFGPRRRRPTSLPATPNLHPFIASYSSPINFFDLPESTLRSRDSDRDSV